MGRYNLAAQKVHSHATQLLKLGRLTAPPPWYYAMGSMPSSEVLTRKPMQRKQTRSRKASRMFQPVELEHAEDQLRWEFFNDHPWELARPRVVLENDGRDLQKWDWSHPLCPPRWDKPNQDKQKAANEWRRTQKQQTGRPINGEAVIQRQQWLMRQGMSRAAAYDLARKELYRVRHAQEVAQQVAKEEAMHYGAVFAPSAIERGMELEDQAYEQWRDWAAQEVTKAKQIASSAYTGQESEDTEAETSEVAEELADSIPGSKSGRTALGGAAFRP